MSQNPPIKPKLNDVDYFNYFESQSDGWIYDEFSELWEKFDLDKFDVITHFNTLQVYKLMIEKRCKRIEQIHQMWKISDENDKNIKILNQEKLEAIMEIDKLKSRIQELEFLWAQQKNSEKILQEKIKELETSVKSKNVMIQKYCDAENELEKEREKFKAEITELQNKNQELQEALNIALNKYQEVTKPSPSKKELIGKIKLMEDVKQILAKKNEEQQKIAKAEYQKVYDENRRLKLQLENSQKNGGKTNYRVRKSGRPKYQPQNVNGQNLNQTRFPMQQHLTQNILNPPVQNAPYFPQTFLQQQHFQHQQMMMMQQPWYFPQMPRSSYFQ